jgi:hypothetical protein
VKLTRRIWHSPSLIVVCLAFTLGSTCFLCATAGAVLPNKNTPATLVVRWREGAPGCTFSRSADGRYDYGMGSEDLSVILAIDSQELEKVRRRHERFFSVALTVKYRGASTIDVSPDNISLQFVKHFKVEQPPLDPEAFSQKIQNDADELDHQMAREMQKHPEQKEAKQASMRTFQKETSELLEFLSKNTLKPSRLDSAKPEVTGWVLFSTDSRWIGAWKKQEEFILRLPVAGKVFEFPFKLPPQEGELLLRQRE